MSSQLAPAAGAGPTAPTEIKAQVQSHPPIRILSNPTAQAYSHLHPALIASIFGLRFSALVADPVTTLSTLLPVFAVLQIIYVIICLPAAGTTLGSSNKARSSGKIGAGLKRKDADNSIGPKIVPAILSLSLPLVLGTPALTTLLILFGAPLTTHLPHTALCAAHMSILAGTGLVYVHGTDASVWREIWSISKAVDTVWGATIGMALGAWLGAVPIPLDWDRPWQVYPITIITGAYIGYVLGCWVGRAPFLYGKRIQFSEEEAEQMNPEKKDI
ncbi:Glycosylphosphatidylinositol (GPI) anchor assembly protein [Microsporum audouinii]